MLRVYAIATAAALLAAPATAATITEKYTAFSAENGPGVKSGGHSLWINERHEIPGFGKRYDFLADGLFTLQRDMNTLAPVSGTLTGTADSETSGKSGSGFIVDFAFDDVFETFSSDPLPKIENGFDGDIDGDGESDWEYLDFSGGTLTGYGELAGLNFDVTRRPARGPYATQFGLEGSVKNAGLGLSHWLWLTVDCGDNQICDGRFFQYNTTTLAHGSKLKGDININIAPVPLPAPAFMLLMGVGALGLYGRRKTRAEV